MSARMLSATPSISRLAFVWKPLIVQRVVAKFWYFVLGSVWKKSWTSHVNNITICERERAFLEPQWASRYVHGFSMWVDETCYTSHHDLCMSSLCRVLSKMICTPPRQCEALSSLCRITFLNFLRTSTIDFAGRSQQKSIEFLFMHFLWSVRIFGHSIGYFPVCPDSLLPLTVGRTDLQSFCGNFPPSSLSLHSWCPPTFVTSCVEVSLHPAVPLFEELTWTRFSTPLTCSSCQGFVKALLLWFHFPCLPHFQLFLRYSGLQSFECQLSLQLPQTHVASQGWGIALNPWYWKLPNWLCPEFPWRSIGLVQLQTENARIHPVPRLNNKVQLCNHDSLTPHCLLL